MMANPGRLPREAIGKRIVGRLRNGMAFGHPLGWPADGKQGCRWSLTGHPFDIAEWAIAA